MKLVVGLGNPGSTYALTKHNAGFLAADGFVAAYGGIFRKQKNFELAELKVNGHQVFVLKPLTFMNLSGEAVAPLVGYYKMALADIVVVHDELDVEFGLLKLKIGGGHAGHNGLKSIDQHLAAQAKQAGVLPNSYARIRVGIGRPPHPAMDVADWVLAKFSHEEQKKLPEIIENINDCIEAFIDGLASFQLKMNALHRR